MLSPLTIRDATGGAAFGPRRRLTAAGAAAEAGAPPLADRDRASSATRPVSHPAVGDPAALKTDLVDQLRTTARAYCTAFADLEHLANRLADLEGRLRGPKHRASTHHDPRPPARKLAADVALGHPLSLRPFVPFVDVGALSRAEIALASPAVDASEGGARTSPLAE